MKFSASGTMNLTWPEIREAVLLAEQLGFEEYYTSDHLMGVAGFDTEKGLLDSVALLPGLAAITSRIRLGCLVSPITFRNPTILLRQLQTVDAISGGRAIAGLGAGWSPTEHAEFGFAFPSLRERMDNLEAACVQARELWPRLRPRPVQDQVRMLLAGSSPRALQMAARYADAWNAIGTPRYMADKVAQLRTLESTQDRGPSSPLEITVSLMATLSDDPEVIAQTKERVILAAAAATSRASEGSAQKQTSVVSDGSATAIFIGTADELTAQIARYEAAGVDRVILSLPRPFSAESLRQFAAVLMG